MRLLLLLACASAILATVGCGGSDDSSGVGNVTVVKGFDLEITMDGYAATLEAESAILNIILDPNDRIDQGDAQAYWALLQKRLVHADELEAMLTADAGWAKAICEWYDAMLREPWLEVVTLRNRISERDRATEGRSAYLQLLLDAAGSPEAVRDQMKLLNDHVASPTNLHIMCVKFEFIEDD